MMGFLVIHIDDEIFWWYKVMGYLWFIDDDNWDILEFCNTLLAIYHGIWFESYYIAGKV